MEPITMSPYNLIMEKDRLGRRTRLGQRNSPETNQKIRAARHALKAERGYLNSPEAAAKIAAANRGRTAWNKGVTGLWGSNSGSFQPGHQRNARGLTPISQLIRTSLPYDAWRRQVFERDFYTCTVCFDNSGGNLAAHHIITLAYLIQKMRHEFGKDGLYQRLMQAPFLFDLSNGQTLCTPCHKAHHAGHPNNRLNDAGLRKFLYGN